LSSRCFGSFLLVLILGSYIAIKEEKSIKVIIYSNLFKPGSSRPAAGGKEQIAICIVKLDRGSISEAVGGGEL
jgi:hypothetical protein